jgi:glycine dehydrogenase subunit 1
MAMLGDVGLTRVAEACWSNTQALGERLAAVGIEPRFEADHFHEMVFDFGVGAADTVARMSGQGVLAGHLLDADYPDLRNCVLACATETKTATDLDRFVDALKQAKAA